MNWVQPWGNLPAEVMGYDGLTGTWLLRARDNGMIGWVCLGAFEWQPNG